VISRPARKQKTRLRFPEKTLQLARLYPEPLPTNLAPPKVTPILTIGPIRPGTAQIDCQTTADHDPTGPITTDLDFNKVPVSRGFCCVVIDGDLPGTHS